MKKILIIPHHPGLSKIKIRLIEIAKTLSSEYIVYLVNWNIMLEEYSLMGRLCSTLKDVFTKIKFYNVEKFNINLVEFSILHRPLCLVPNFNYFWLKKIIEKEKIDTVINGSYYMFSFPEKRDFKYIFDIADLPAPTKDTSFDKFIWKQTNKEIRKAEAITVVSKGLVNYILRDYQREAFFIPNGADIQRLRSVKQADVDKIRQKYNLIGKWVIGYIGYMGSWVNIKLVVEAFKEIKSQIPDAVLMWIGASSDVENLRKKYADDNIIFTGGIEEDIEPYFNLLDLGILPHRKSLLQDVAFHIKLIEYTAAGKFVISTPLEESKRLAFPNMIFAPEDKTEWASAIKKAREKKWQKEWDDLVAGYDWKEIANKFIGLIEG